MDFWHTDIRYLKGVGQARAKKFEKLGITDYRSLLEHYPRGYIDHRQTVSIAKAYEHIGETVSIIALIASPVNARLIRKGLTISKVRIADESAVMQLTFFNNPYLKNMLQQGEQYLFYGKIEQNGASVTMTSPYFEPAGQNFVPKLRPVYPLTAGLTARMISGAIGQLLPQLPDFDPLPAYIKEAVHLPSYTEALRSVHAPESDEALAKARKRLSFSELFFYLLGLNLIRKTVKKDTRFRSGTANNSFVKLSPFTPTNAQYRVISDIRQDLASGKTMNRLLQGDVGSGKTFVAGDAAWQMLAAGYQVAVMAPTSILASQHYTYFAPLFAKLGKKCALLVGAMTAKAKKEVYDGLADGSIDFVVGTHALIQKEVRFHSLSLVITDEQHRFGVLQRGTLSEKGSAPHILAMSATPIPRTMALILYGDLDISVIDELPKGRQQIDTFLVDSSYEQRLYRFIEKQLSLGGSVYFVCPLIEDENGESELTGVKEQADILRQKFGTTVGLLHGKMRPTEKDQMMSDFAEGNIRILVSTTVIEVGINVPCASLMIIRDAERFGLSQLHQLRGRVGRGTLKSYCVLISDTKSLTAKKRMKFFCSTTDGFLIAKEDLALRGPGDLIGSRQSGENQIDVIYRNCDMRLLDIAARAAKHVLEIDPTLSDIRHAETKSFLLDKFKENGDIFS